MISLTRGDWGNARTVLIELEVNFLDGHSIHLIEITAGALDGRSILDARGGLHSRKLRV